MDSPDLAILQKITSYLESHNSDTIKLKDVGLVNLTKGQLDCLFVQAAAFFGQAVKYKPSSKIHLLLLKTLLQNGADISSMWRSDDYDYYDDFEYDVPFVEMFRRGNRTALDDIKFLIEEKHVLSNLLQNDLTSCFIEAILERNSPLLQLLIDNGAIMASDHVFLEMEEILGDGRYGNMAEFGQIFDLMLQKKTTVDLEKLTPLREITPEVSTTVLQWLICQFLYNDRERSDDLDNYEDDWDFLLGKGHLAPPPEAFTCALRKCQLTFIFAAVYLCLTRGIELKFPDLRMEDKSKFNWADADDRTKKVAGLVEEMIHRSGCSCPHSFRLTLSKASGAGRKFPSLKEISVAAIRKSWLVPDKEERFPDSKKPLRDVPVKPRLIIPTKVRSMIPPVLCDMLLLKDLREGVRND